MERDIQRRGKMETSDERGLRAERWRRAEKVEQRGFGTDRERGRGGKIRGKWEKAREGDSEGNRTKGGRNSELNSNTEKYKRDIKKKRARWASEKKKRN
jgi:hypothetical protein